MTMPYCDYTEQELEASLRRAFVDHRADHIMLDDRRQRFLWQSAALGVDRGWLVGRQRGPDEQDQWIEYRLTKAGSDHFGLSQR